MARYRLTVFPSPTLPLARRTPPRAASTADRPTLTTSRARHLGRSAASPGGDLTPIAPAPARALRLAAPVLVLASLIASLSVTASPPLPACDAPAVNARLREALVDIPAVAALTPAAVRRAALERPRPRGHRGGRTMRACHGWLRTSAGAGTLEYSIRHAPSEPDGIAVRAELFQGGWRTSFLSSSSP